MHNKTITIDHQICVMGGRNIADEYFDFSHTYNFRDRDVLLTGEAVKSVNASLKSFGTINKVFLFTIINEK
jgi:cardiolipin synthase C